MKHQKKNTDVHIAGNPYSRRDARALLCLILLFWCGAGCANLNLNQLTNTGLYTIFELSGIVVQLSSLEYQDNMDGLIHLEEKYDVELTDPTEAFFEAAKEEVLALTALKEAMEENIEGAERGVEPFSPKEIERVLRALEQVVEIQE